MKSRITCVVVAFLLFVLSLAAQTASSGSTSSQVPPLIPFASVATDSGGSSLSGVASITFSLYAAQRGGEALWTETQNNVELDATGHYSVQLGITKPNGVPATLFTSGEARWLGVQIAEQGEQTRVLLLSVPYALKAGDAATIGGLPPSAFVLAASASAASAPTAFVASATSAADTPEAATDVTGAGTVDFIPLWTSTSNIANSVLFQSGTKVGINTTTPATALDVKGGGTIRGTLSLPSTATATATAGANSQPLTLAASAYNSSTPAAVNETFQLQAVATGNDTATPSANLSLLFGSGTTKPAATGLHIASTGQITFATGQTFPGAGTLSGVTTATGSGLTGGGTTGTLKLGLLTTCASGQVLEWSGTAWACASVSGGGGGTITGVTAGTDLTGGGTSGNVTLSLNTAKIPQLSAANTFVGNQTVTGNVTASGEVQGGVVNATTGFDLGGTVFAIGSVANQNAFPGFAGNSTMTGGDNTASGWQALWSNTSGGGNMATGPFALYSNTTGSDNTAAGVQALYSNTASYNTASGFDALYSNTTGIFNTSSGYGALDFSSSGSENTGVGAFSGGESDGSDLTGSNNTALGYNSEFSTGTLTNATAIGANALVSESDALVLGSGVNVGIGTSAPAYTLDVESSNVAVHGDSGGTSSMGAEFGANSGSGVWGDNGDSSNAGFFGVLGTSDNNSAGGFYNTNTSSPTIFAFNDQDTDSSTPVLETSGGYPFGGAFFGDCVITAGGDLSCSGSVSDVVSADSGARKVSLYSVQSSENWFEDAGSGQLSNGSARIALDSTFAQTVNAGVEYHVFLTPNGDSKGLYVSQKTATGFEVHEQGGGTSSIAFDYRIMAKRVGYENVRLTDVTQQFNKREARREQMMHPVRRLAVPQSVPKLPIRPVPSLRAVQARQAQVNHK
jgi:hypothetical protein